MSDEPVLPAYGRGCVTDLIPALLGPEEPADALVGPEILDASSVVVLVPNRCV